MTSANEILSDMDRSAAPTLGGSVPWEGQGSLLAQVRS